MIERGVILTDNHQTISLSSLFPSLSEPSHPLNVNSLGQLSKKTQSDEIDNTMAVEEMLDENFSLEALETQLINKAMDLTNNNISKAARKLGLTRPALAYRLKKIQDNV